MLSSIDSLWEKLEHINKRAGGRIPEDMQHIKEQICENDVRRKIILNFVISRFWFSAEFS